MNENFIDKRFKNGNISGNYNFEELKIILCYLKKYNL